MNPETLEAIIVIVAAGTIMATIIGASVIAGILIGIGLCGGRVKVKVE
ncbi:hypothetical protein LCGC14_0952820 [marine sediment metagenome]|uniref:Uncharacterized protein n=1 Tax=marine sediment metagenome TaxID=412755 RepID=A0A0F9R021_9ZZZZ